MLARYFQLCCLLGLCWLAACTPAVQPPVGPPIVPPSPSSTVAVGAPGATSTAASTPSATTTPPAAPTESITLTLALTPTRAPTRTQTLSACLAAGGRIVTYTLETKLARYPLEVRVYLPPCYSEHLAETYPALYLIHGQSFNDDQWDRLGVDETADRLIAAGELPPFLIVMPRDSEWTQSDADPFGQMFIEFLLPWVDRTFRTRPERSQRAVGGLSRGAGWAVHFGLKYADQFSALGAHSPAVFWTDTPYIVQWLDSAEHQPRIYIDMGDRDRQEISESALWFESLLTRHNIPHEWYLFHGQHNEDYWGAHVEQYLRWYAAEW